jgi:hypothetical protein
MAHIEPLSGLRKTIFTSLHWQSIKIPINYCLNLICDKLPEPTKDNTWHPNSKVLIELRDEFFQHLINPGREKIYRAIWNFVIAIYDYDPAYRFLIDWIGEQWKRKTWTPREPLIPGEKRYEPTWWIKEIKE